MRSMIKRKKLADEYRMQISVTMDYKDTLTFIVLQYHCWAIKFTGKWPSVSYFGLRVFTW